MRELKEPKIFYVQLGSSGVTEKQTYPSDIPIVQKKDYDEINDKLFETTNKLFMAQNTISDVYGMLILAQYDNQNKQNEDVTEALKIIRNWDAFVNKKTRVEAPTKPEKPKLKIVTKE